MTVDYLTQKSNETERFHERSKHKFLCSKDLRIRTFESFGFRFNIHDSIQRFNPAQIVHSCTIAGLACCNPLRISYLRSPNEGPYNSRQRTLPERNRTKTGCHSAPHD